MIRSDLIPLYVVALITLIAAMTDLWKFKVYNALTFPAILSGLIVSTAMGGLAGLSSSFLGAALGFGTLVLCFALGGVGAGDVKLMTAVGAWLGPYLTYRVFLTSALAAGVYALALVVLQGGVFSAIAELLVLKHRMLSPASWVRPKSSIEVEARRGDRRRRLVPFAAMTCVGYFLTLFWLQPNRNAVSTASDRHIPVASASAPSSGGIR